jgi:cell division protein ZapA
VAENNKNISKNKVLVNIMGQEYVIKGEASPDYIESLATMVHRKMQNIANKNHFMSQSKIAVLVALNMADDLKKAIQAYENLVKEIEDEKNHR